MQALCPLTGQRPCNVMFRLRCRSLHGIQDTSASSRTTHRLAGFHVVGGDPAVDGKLAVSAGGGQRVQGAAPQPLLRDSRPQRPPVCCEPRLHMDSWDQRLCSTV